VFCGKAQKMTESRGVTCAVPERSPARQKARPSAEWGRRAVELAAAIGKSKQELARAAGYTGGPKDPTIDRLVRGQGSLLLAFAVRRALKDWGIDVSVLPPLEGDSSLLPDWQQEWNELGEQLHRVATPERFQVEVDRVRKVVEAHELVAEGTGTVRPRQK
jgi:hypothetical protein